MSEALELSFFLPYAVFRNPLTFNYTQTYPLPPPSTVIGMIQKSLKRFNVFDEWKKGKIWISIKGKHKSIFTHYVRKVKGNSYISVPIINVVEENEARRLIDSQRKPIIEQELYSLELLLHFKAEDANLLEEIQNSLTNTRGIISIGRAENVAFYQREPRKVKVEEKIESIDSVYTSYDTYAQPSHFKNKSNEEKFLSLSFIEASYEKDQKLYYSAFADVERPTSLKIERFYKLLFIEKNQQLSVNDLGERVEFINIENKNKPEPVFWIGYEY